MNDNHLSHIGTKRHSGRYPWGSGDNPRQRGDDFLKIVKELHDQGLSETEIAEGLGMNTSELRTRKSIAKQARRAELRTQALKLKDKGMSHVAIGLRMGLNESSVRALLDPALKERSDISLTTAAMLKDQVKKHGLIDIGGGVESQIGISRTKLDIAASLLKDEGYTINYLEVEQLGTGKKTSLKVLAPPGMDSKQVYANRFDIKNMSSYSEDGGRSFLGLEPINNISSKRVLIRYAEEGGSDKDGVIEIRPGVDDLSLGSARYAQVRIGVDGSHYMKGMAMYADDIPSNYDIVYNTNKKKGTPPERVYKEMEVDSDNPFGAIVRQQHYITKEGKKIPDSDKMLAMKKAGVDYKQIAKNLGVSEDTVKRAVTVKAVNLLNEEGDWTEWSRNLSSQVLSKQTPALAEKQLGLARSIKEQEFNEIMSLTNPVVKKALLNSFADDADAAAVHLKAAALPRQASHVLLPFPDMRENEIYAPNYKHGERVALIRHPHGGIFEIAELTVNNHNQKARKLLGNALDGVGINPKIASKLSGADFDGDTVLVIPNGKKEIRSAPTLKALVDFDTKQSYAPYDGMKTIDGGVWDAKSNKVTYTKPPRSKTMQIEMGKASNLITDMTIKGASPSEIARAVKHSMVVIDSEKHHLDYKRSEIDNGISALKLKYQGGSGAGASTLISRASSEKRINERSDSFSIDPKTGKKIYKETGRTYVNKEGKVVLKTTKTTKLAVEDDAYNLSSGTKIEDIYANHSNSLKALANRARKALLATPNLVYSPSAKKLYANEVASLKVKLNEANKNRPLERRAQLLANKIVAAKKQANPHMDASDLKKIKGQALEEARKRVGAGKQKIVITDREWNAIQLGAISNNSLTKIVQNTDLDLLKQRATPRTAYKMTTDKVARAKAMAANNLSTSEIANALGVSVTTIQETLK